jgi:hypothetical protein
MNIQKHFLDLLKLDLATMQPEDELYKTLVSAGWRRKGKPRGKPFPKGEENPQRKK